MTTDEGQQAEARAGLVDVIAEVIADAHLEPAGISPRDIAARVVAATAEEIAARDRTLAEARLLAEHWIRSSDNRTRRLGADLKQVLDG